MVTQIFSVILLLALSGCGGNFVGNDTGSTVSSTSLNAGESEPGARIVFKDTDFTDITDFFTSPVTSHQCLGDVLKVYYVDGDDYMGLNGGLTALPTPSVADDLFPTNRPAFVRNVSVDITNTYYPDSVVGSLVTDNCSSRANVSSPPPSSCADFDRTPPLNAAAVPLPTIAPTPTPSPTPVPSVTPGTTEYYESNYYRVRDDWCSLQGPTVSPDPEVTKAGVGGVSIDLDRTQLGAYEDLLMVVTYHALDENSTATSWPAVLNAGTAQTTNDHTVLKVNLVCTSQSLDSILQVSQPRTSTYTNTTAYPIYMKEIATLEDSFGSLRTEQVYIPLSQNALIDRIRIERIRGSYHLYQIDLYRLGNRTE